MKKSLLALGHFWQRSRLSLILAAVLVIAVIFYGLHDVGLLLGYIATAIVMIELTRRWRRIRSFLILFLASFLGIIFLAFLHEVIAVPFINWLLWPGAENSPGFRIFSDIISLMMIFLCVVGMVIGIAGAVILGIWRLVSGKSKPTTSPT
jgi:hypothetical protein